MSACYSVNVELRVKEDCEEKIIKTLQDKIKRAKEEMVDYGIEEIPNTLKELLGIFFVSHGDYYNYKQVGTWYWVDSSFNASYGWESVMINMFEEIAPYLENKSELYIDIENDYDKIIIKNGKAIQKH